MPYIDISSNIYVLDGVACVILGVTVSQVPAIHPGCMHAITYASKLRAPRKTDEPQTQYNEFVRISIH